MHARLLAYTVLASITFVSASAAQPAREDVSAEAPRVVRPPAGSLRRGALPVPAWVVYGSGGLLLVAAGGGLLRRLLPRTKPPTPDPRTREPRREDDHASE